VGGILGYLLVRDAALYRRVQVLERQQKSQQLALDVYTKRALDLTDLARVTSIVVTNLITAVEELQGEWEMYSFQKPKENL
jgi:hypothetical protein